MNKRQIVYSLFGALGLTLLSIFLFDQPIAAFGQRVGGRSWPLFQEGTSLLEVLFGFTVAKYALTCALLAVAAVFFIWKSMRPTAWLILFVACTQLVTRVTAGTLKNVFQRLRPFEVIQAGNWDWKFFGDHGSSFPSGHAAFFWGLFFPLAFLFPRFRILLAIIPLFIAVARVGVNDHWCSDVLASIAIAALITLLFIWIFRMKPAQKGGEPVHG